MRKFRASQSLRPTINELRTFLLSPQSQPIRCSSRVSPSSKYAKPSISSSQWQQRHLGTTNALLHPSAPPKNRDRGPESTEDTQTDFGVMDVLGNTEAPSTAIDACLSDGFHLDNGIKVTGGDGVLLVAGEAFTWRPWEVSKMEQTAGGAVARGQKLLVNKKGQFEVEDEAWGVFGLVWPKPDLLILGLGGEMRPLSPKTRQYLNSLGIRVDISDTRNAAAMFNLLATERGTSSVAAALVPIG